MKAIAILLRIALCLCLFTKAQNQSLKIHKFYIQEKERQVKQVIDHILTELEL